MKSSRKLKESDKKVIAASQLWKCKMCENLLTSSYQIDHIVPYSISYDDKYTNLQALCANCHSSKSQRENIRIIQYKKITALSKKILCWFCIKELNNNHKCNKTLNNITIPKTKKEFKTIDQLDKFMYTKDDTTLITQKVSDISLDDKNVLKIRLLPAVIFINNYFTDFINFEEYNMDRISKAIETALSIQEEKILYSEIEVDLSKFNPYAEDIIPDDLIEHIDIHLKKIIPKNILKPNVEVDYVYIT
jgi:hypothetical protein